MSVFTDDEALVRQTLGFKPKQFLVEVSNLVDSSLVHAIDTYKRELLSIANSKGYENITASVVDDSCQELLERMQSAYSKNMDKFELYALRNIFSLPAAAADSNAALASKQSLDKVSHELEQTRQKYLQMQAQKNQLTMECEQGEALLKDMRSALFTMKVGSQVLEEYEVAPLDATVNSVVSKQVELQALCTRAMAIVEEMEESTGMVEDDTPTNATGIQTGQAFETGKITEAMR